MEGGRDKEGFGMGGGKEREGVRNRKDERKAVGE